MNHVTCKWCGVKTPEIDGPTHKYLESTPGCWELFGKLLAREYENLHYFEVHSLTVDAYALQHPGQESPQTINSQWIHLASLYAYFSSEYDLNELSMVKQKLSHNKSRFYWLEPPDQMSEINVSDVLTAQSAKEHIEIVQKWAKYVYEAWEKYHNLLDGILN